ncbi:hypothetical protein D1872_281120 [compost metagenome]
MHQHTAQRAAQRLRLFIAARRRRSLNRRGRNMIVAVQTGHFFDQVDIAGNIAAARRHANFQNLLRRFGEIEIQPAQ